MFCKNVARAKCSHNTDDAGPEIFWTLSNNFRQKAKWKMSKARHLWRNIWGGIFLIGLGILLWLDSLPKYRGIFLPGLLILIGILIILDAVIRHPKRDWIQKQKKELKRTRQIDRKPLMLDEPLLSEPSQTPSIGPFLTSPLNHLLLFQEPQVI